MILSSYPQVFGKVYFPAGTVGKDSTCWCKRHRFETWVGKIPWKRKWLPTPVFLPEQRSLVGYSPWGCRVRHDQATNTALSLSPQLKNRDVNHPRYAGLLWRLMSECMQSAWHIESTMSIITMHFLLMYIWIHIYRHGEVSGQYLWVLRSKIISFLFCVSLCFPNYIAEACTSFAIGKHYSF